MSRAFRDATLELAREHPFARAWSTAAGCRCPRIFRDSPLNAPDSDDFGDGLRPGSPAIDAPQLDRWFLGELDGRFTLVRFDPEASGDHIDLGVPVDLKLMQVDPAGKLAQLAAAERGSCLLFRPDQHLMGRWRRFEAHKVRGAIHELHSRRCMSMNSPKLLDPDAFYQALVKMHEGLDTAQSQQLNAKLILLMAERIGDDEVLQQLLRRAAQGP